MSCSDIIHPTAPDAEEPQSAHSKRGGSNSSNSALVISPPPAYSPGYRYYRRVLRTIQQHFYPTTTQDNQQGCADPESANLDEWNPWIILTNEKSLGLGDNGGEGVDLESVFEEAENSDDDETFRDVYPADNIQITGNPEQDLDQEMANFCSSNHSEFEDIKLLDEVAKELRENVGIEILESTARDEDLIKENGHCHSPVHSEGHPLKHRRHWTVSSRDTDNERASNNGVERWLAGNVNDASGDTLRSEGHRDADAHLPSYNQLFSKGQHIGSGDDTEQCKLPHNNQTRHSDLYNNNNCLDLRRYYINGNRCSSDLDNVDFSDIQGNISDVCHLQDTSDCLDLQKLGEILDLESDGRDATDQETGSYLGYISQDNTASSFPDDAKTDTENDCSVRGRPCKCEHYKYENRPRVKFDQWSLKRTSTFKQVKFSPSLWLSKRCNNSQKVQDVQTQWQPRRTNSIETSENNSLLRCRPGFRENLVSKSNLKKVVTFSKDVVANGSHNEPRVFRSSEQRTSHHSHMTESNENEPEPYMLHSSKQSGSPCGNATDSKENKSESCAFRSSDQGASQRSIMNDSKENKCEPYMLLSSEQRCSRTNSADSKQEEPGTFHSSDQEASQLYSATDSKEKKREPYILLSAKQWNCRSGNTTDFKVNKLEPCVFPSSDHRANHHADDADSKEEKPRRYMFNSSKQRDSYRNATDSKENGPEPYMGQSSDKGASQRSDTAEEKEIEPFVFHIACHRGNTADSKENKAEPCVLRNSHQGASHSSDKMAKPIENLSITSRNGYRFNGFSYDQTIPKVIEWQRQTQGLRKQAEKSKTACDNLTGRGDKLNIRYFNKVADESLSPGDYIAESDGVNYADESSQPDKMIYTHRISSTMFNKLKCFEKEQNNNCTKARLDLSPTERSEHRVTEISPLKSGYVSALKEWLGSVKKRPVGRAFPLRPEEAPNEWWESNEQWECDYYEKIEKTDGHDVQI